MSIGNTTYTETKKQGFSLPPPPLKPRKMKAPEDCNWSFIDQIQDGLYGGSKLVRNEPRTTSDTYFVIKTRATEVRSYRRNYSHKSVALFRTKKGGSTRENIAFMTGSFVELDGSTDSTLKTKEDIQTLIEKNNLPTASVLSRTSPGNFHIIWTYDNPLPWNERNESYWLSVQKRYIELFQKAGFLVDVSASLNPCQFLRNPSQLQPYNYKRRCRIEIHKSYKKTSLRAIFRALNGTDIANPKRLQAGVKLRRYSRANKTFTATNAELAETLGTCTKTAQRIVKRAVANGDLEIVRRIGNNNGIKRTTEYTSNLYLEPNSQKGQVSSIKTNSVQTEGLLRDFKRRGTSVGRRNRTIIALGLYLKAQLGEEASIETIRDALEGGAMRCNFSEREFEKTLRNVMKSTYDHPLSRAKMRQWNLLEETNFLHSH